MSQHQGRPWRDVNRHRFAQLHLRVRRLVTERLRSLLPTPFLLTPVNARVLRAWKRTWVPYQPGSHSPSGGWNWPELAERFRRRPDYFHVAVWEAGELVGLGIGGVTSGVLEVFYLEASPVPGRPGRVLVPMLEFAEAWARALGLDEVRLIDPLAEVVRLYAEAGYMLVMPPRGKPYCRRKV